MHAHVFGYYFNSCLTIVLIVLAKALVQLLASGVASAQSRVLISSVS